MSCVFFYLVRFCPHPHLEIHPLCLCLHMWSCFALTLILGYALCACCRACLCFALTPILNFLDPIHDTMTVQGHKFSNSNFLDLIQYKITVHESQYITVHDYKFLNS